MVKKNGPFQTINLVTTGNINKIVASEPGTSGQKPFRSLFLVF